jgi:hypothetical protein
MIKMNQLLQWYYSIASAQSFIELNGVSFLTKTMIVTSSKFCSLVILHDNV